MQKSGVKPHEAPGWMNQAIAEAQERAKKTLALKKKAERFTQYQSDPIGFCEEILGDRFTDDVKQVILSVRDNPVTVARSGNATGKTHGAARVITWFFMAYPDAQVYVTAAPPLENLKKLLWGEVLSVAGRNPTIFTGFNMRTLEIRRSARSFISGVAIPTAGTQEEREAKFSGKHAPHLMFVVDEGDAVPDEVYRGIESCMSGGHIRLLIMFNPRAKAGPVYKREAEKRANVVELSAFRHPNVVTGENIIPGAVDRQVTVRRIVEWTRPLARGEEPDQMCFKVPDFLIGFRAQSLSGEYYPPLVGGYRKIVQNEFAYMVLGIYPAQGSSRLIEDEFIDAAVDRWKSYIAINGEIPPVGVKPKMGLDIAEFGADSNCAIFRYGGYTAMPIIWNGLDVDESTGRALQEYIKHNADIVYVDGMGLGASVAPAMARRGRDNDVRAVSIKATEKPSPVFRTELGEFKYLRDQCYWGLREWLMRDPSAMLPNDSMLLEELKVIEYEDPKGFITITAKDKIREVIRRSPDRADALANTFAPFDRAKVQKVRD